MRGRSMSLPRPISNHLPMRQAHELSVAMKNQINISQDLDVFLQKVFRREDLMREILVPDYICNGVYDLYTQLSNPETKINRVNNLHLARSIWGRINTELPDGVATHAFFQNTNVPLGAANYFSKRFFVGFKMLEDFLCFSGFLIGANVKYRVYVNIDFRSALDAINIMLKLPGGVLQEIDSFKIAGPGANRSDTFVIYCQTMMAANEIATAMVRAINAQTLRSIDHSTPFMTWRIGPGVSIGAEPKRQITGFASPWNKKDPHEQSFGTIRSELIASAIMHYRENRRILGEGYPVFRQFVAIGFKGAGLDPAHPWR